MSDKNKKTKKEKDQELFTKEDFLEALDIVIARKKKDKKKNKSSDSGKSKTSD
jgi:uncharacterized protein YqgQ